jgi:two-component system response regulator
MTRPNTILMVDDNPDFIELARRAFGKACITNPVVVAEDGAEALAYLFATGAWAGRSRESNPALVLLDLKLPRIGGMEVLLQLRADPRTRNLPVVILTTSVEERDVIRSYELGCNSYIRKPIDFVQLADAIRQLGQYWLTLNEPPPAEGGA